MNKSVNEIKMLALDQIFGAQSGHPGMALGSATAMYTLFNYFLNNTAKNPKFINRDRFYLSSGHVSALLYSLLHLSNFTLTMEDLKKFRQINSHTPGHPEYDINLGIEASTGPLGQGLAMGIGSALGAKMMAKKYNRDNFNIIDHYTYILVGDGDLQEGISQEAISFAGHLQIDKLIVFYDNNDVTLDGPLSNTNSDDVVKRFEASNWNVLKIKDFESIEEFKKVIIKAKKSTQPTLIVYKSIIGIGSKNQGKNVVHGAPLKEEDMKQLRLKLVGDQNPFFVSEETYNDFKENIIKRSEHEYHTWNKMYKEYKAKYGELAADFEKSVKKELDLSALDTYSSTMDKEISTRDASNIFLNLLVRDNSCLVGGSADVASSVRTHLNSFTINTSSFVGQNINFGIREFAMSAISNGLYLHGGFIPFAGTFLAFSDYAKPALRLSALMGLPIIYLYSHDSVAVGEDGPTHEPIEQLAMLRCIPNFSTIRPCNDIETKYAYKMALTSKKPTAIILTRQKLITKFIPDEEDFNKGAYFVALELRSKYTILATGSEVGLALEIYNKFLKENIFINVVSVPSFDRFEEQEQRYKEKIIPHREHAISLEMLSTFGWSKYAMYNIGLDSFGFSGKMEDVINKCEFDFDSVYKKIKSIVEN